jgi:tetratricopeptide (TPR) repeat protein
LYRRSGQYELALQDYDHALALTPDDPDAYGGRARTRCALKQYDQAWEDVRKWRSLGGTPSSAFIEELTAASGRAE